MVSQVVVGEHLGHGRQLVQPHPVLTCDRPAVGNAEIKDFGGQFLGALLFALYAVVEEHQGVEVAVTGMEDVRHSYTGFGR